MTYEYECRQCHSVVLKQRCVEDRNLAVACGNCSNDAKSIFCDRIVSLCAPPITERWVDRRENRVVPVGGSMKDAVEEAKAADKRYDYSYSQDAIDRRSEQEYADHKYLRLEQDYGIKPPEVVQPKDVKPMKARQN